MQSVCARHLQHHLAVYGGRKGREERVHWVYDRAGEPCRRCGTPVRRILQGQRSTFYCPACQGGRPGPRGARPLPALRKAR